MPERIIDVHVHAMRAGDLGPPPQAFDLPARLSIDTRSTHRDVESANLVARLEGSDPELRDEHVVYVAHVDHFGRGVPMNGDDIYNGAHDNASGVAIVLEVAKAFAALPTPPRRSTLFLFVTAEERGLLGSTWWVRHPSWPLERIRAVINLDAGAPPAARRPSPPRAPAADRAPPEPRRHRRRPPDLRRAAPLRDRGASDRDSHPVSR